MNEGLYKLLEYLILNLETEKDRETATKYLAYAYDSMREER